MIRLQKKREAVLVFLFCELFFAGYIYFFGCYGFLQLISLRDTIQKLQHEVDVQHHDISQLQHQIAMWHSSSFYKEKFAREQLHMARKGEIIYKIG